MLTNQIVAITGGAGKIGSAFCRGVIEHGGKVVIGDIAKDRGVNLESELGSDLSIFVELDTSNMDSIKNFLSVAHDHFGHIDSAVHCAYPRSSQWGEQLENLKPEELSEDLFTQLGGAILFSQQMLLYFRKQAKGNLIHIASIQGIAAPKFSHYQGTTMVSPIEYTAIKSAIIAITKYLAKYCKNQNIRVNSISPGGILDDQSEAFLEQYAKSCNSKGMLDANDLIGSLIFLLSDQSLFLNGQNIVVDDGWSL